MPGYQASSLSGINGSLQEDVCPIGVVKVRLPMPDRSCVGVDIDGSG